MGRKLIKIRIFSVPVANESDDSALPKSHFEKIMSTTINYDFEIVCTSKYLFYTLQTRLIPRCCSVLPRVAGSVETGRIYSEVGNNGSFMIIGVQRALHMPEQHY